MPTEEDMPLVGDKPLTIAWVCGNSRMVGDFYVHSSVLYAMVKSRAP